MVVLMWVGLEGWSSGEVLAAGGVFSVAIVLLGIERHRSRRRHARRKPD